MWAHSVSQFYWHLEEAKHSRSKIQIPQQVVCAMIHGHPPIVRYYLQRVCTDSLWYNPIHAGMTIIFPLVCTHKQQFAPHMQPVSHTACLTQTNTLQGLICGNPEQRRVQDALFRAASSARAFLLAHSQESPYRSSTWSGTQHWCWFATNSGNGNNNNSTTPRPKPKPRPPISPPPPAPAPPPSPPAAAAEKTRTNLSSKSENNDKNETWEQRKEELE